MNVLSGSIKCLSIGFLIGLLMSTGTGLAQEVLPAAGLMVLISAVLVISKLTGLEQAPTVPANAV